MVRCGILGYGCSSAAGPTVEDFWRGLQTGKDHSRLESGFSSRVCPWPNQDPASSPRSSLVLLTEHLLLAWQECLGRFKQNCPESALKRLGVIFASTKGCIDDWVWQSSPDLSCDPLTPVLDAFIESAQLNPVETICVSNACASSLGAIFLGNKWLKQNRVDYVLILAADRSGQFIRSGFSKLKVVAGDISKPFGLGRDGLYLGDAAAAILLGQESSTFEIESVATDTEGYALTRPGLSGESLKKACMASPHIREQAPDLIIAHGTGTQVNDQIEDEVFTSIFEKERIPVTATKWSIGHTLGASGAMDVIAACEIMTHQLFFKIANTHEVDPSVRSWILSADQPLPQALPVERILLTSLGFGGVHAAALIKQSDKKRTAG